MAKLGYNLWVVGILVLTAFVLGILNNFRVFEERRVVLFGPQPVLEAVP